MGGGAWTSSSYTDYSTSRGRVVTTDGLLDSRYSAQDLFTSRCINEDLKPYNVVRECCDSDEHPNTIPVILALDVTGSMGSAAAEVAKKLNSVMTDLYATVPDVEFMIMGIGDLAYDDAPLQVSQFESDVRIAEHLDKIYFEGGGGGNGFESYTSAWYFGVHHCKLDCWDRGKKGIIITMGDEPLNPYLPAKRLKNETGDSFLQGDVETNDLYKEVIKKFDVYHLAVNDRASSYRYYDREIKNTFGKLLGDNFRVVGLDNIAASIVDIVTDTYEKNGSTTHFVEETNDGISW